MMRSMAMVFLLLSLVSCAVKKNIRHEPETTPLENAAGGLGVFQSGMASWYGDDFHGKPTADGEIYDMHKLTAAHPDLPFHTLVEVENLENQRKVLVRINDRGPFLKNRIIDLSFHAAQMLAMTDNGTAEVNLRVLRWGDGARNPDLSADDHTACFVQAGAFTVRENAEDLLVTLGEIFPELSFRIVSENGMFKVISPKLAGPLACGEVLKKMAAHHLRGFSRAQDIPTAE
jgi:hypothetical protein